MTGFGDDLVQSLNEAVAHAGGDGPAIVHRANDENELEGKFKMAAEQPRWAYRFDNYSRAYGLLRDAVETLEVRDLSQLEKEGLIQRFEYTWELAWKTLKDYLDYSGVVLQTSTPRAVIKAAFAAGIIQAGDIWMHALDTRNRMAHTYSAKTFEETVQLIQTKYLALFEQLHGFLAEQQSNEG